MDVFLGQGNIYYSSIATLFQSRSSIASVAGTIQVLPQSIQVLSQVVQVSPQIGYFPQ